MRQADQKPRLPKIFSVLLALAIALGLCADTPAADDEGRPVSELIEQLSSPVWVEREAATAALLTRGPEAIGLLRASVDHADPEVRNRVRVLLDQLDPWVYDVRLMRFDRRPEDDFLASALHDLRLTSNSGPALLTVETATGESVPLIVAVLLDGNPATVSVTFGHEEASPVETRTLGAGTAAKLRQIDEITVEIADRIRRQVDTVLWTIELRGAARRLEAGAAEGDSPSLTDAFVATRETLARQLDRSDAEARTAALELAGWLADAPLLESVRALAEAESDATDAAELGLARLRAGDESARATLEAWVTDPEFSEDSERRALVAIELTRVGSGIGLTELLGLIAELPSWLQYRGTQAVVARWINGGFDEAQKQTIFERYTTPEVFGFLPWYTDGLVQQLFERLMDDQPFDLTRDRFYELLAGSGGNANGGILRARAVLQALARKVESGEAPAREWVAPTLELATNVGLVEDVSRLIGIAALGGRFAEEDWAAVLDGWEKVLEAGEQTLERRVDDLFSDLLVLQEIPVEQRRRIWRIRAERLAKLDEKMNYLRRAADQKLTTKFGALAQRMPNLADIEAWAERSGQWLAKIAEAPEETFTPPEPGESLVLIEAELRVSPEASAELLRFDRYELTAGVATARRAPASAPALIVLETLPESPAMRRRNQNAKRYRISRATTFLGVPSFRGNSVRRYNAYRFDLAEGDFRPANRPTEVNQTFRTLSWLLPLDSSVTDWTRTVESLVIGAMSDEAQLRDACLDAIGDARVEEALPRLQALYEAALAEVESPEAPAVQPASPLKGIGLTLLRLGDRRARDLLLEDLETSQPREAQEVLAALVQLGDPEAIETLLTWVADPPARMRSQIYPFLQTLERYAARHRTTLDDERWIEALIAALSVPNARTYGTRILRQITGQDFGFARVYQEFPNPTERQAAQEQIVEAWREWARTRSDHRSKSHQR